MAAGHAKRTALAREHVVVAAARCYQYGDPGKVRPLVGRMGRRSTRCTCLFDYRADTDSNVMMR